MKIAVGVVGFLHRLHQMPGIEEVCLTTNRVLLADLAPALYETGLRHLNLSLDTLRRARYREITGQDKLGGCSKESWYRPGFGKSGCTI
jgi:cyclic pyranopterin phosphate synthase